MLGSVGLSRAVTVKVNMLLGGKASRSGGDVMVSTPEVRPRVYVPYDCKCSSEGIGIRLECYISLGIISECSPLEVQ